VTVVQNIPARPGQAGAADRPVIITLVAPGGIGYTATGDISGPLNLTTDNTGHWSADLAPNSSITPSGTYYQVNEDGALSNIVVPATGGPWNLSQVLVTTPPTPAAPGITGVQVAAAGTVDAIRPEVNLIAGSGITIGVADNPSQNRADVTFTATGSGAGALLSANNLSDVASAAQSRTNLGLGTAATANIGTAGGTVAAGNDARFTSNPSRQIAVAADGPGSSVTPPVGTWTPTYLMTSDTGGVWSGWVNVSDGSQNDALSFDFACSAGTYSIELRHLPYTNRGIYTLQIDGVSVGTLDGYSASLIAGRSVLSGVAISAGIHVITLVMATKNASSSGYIGMIERLLLTRTA